MKGVGMLVVSLGEYINLRFCYHWEYCSGQNIIICSREGLF